MIQRNKEYDTVEDLGSHNSYNQTKMSSSKALEEAAKPFTVIRRESASPVPNFSLREERTVV